MQADARKEDPPRPAWFSRQGVPDEWSTSDGPRRDSLRCLRCVLQDLDRGESYSTLALRVESSLGGYDRLAELQSGHTPLLTLRIRTDVADYILFQHPGGCTPPTRLRKGLSLVGEYEHISLPERWSFALYPAGPPSYGDVKVFNGETDRDEMMRLPLCPIEWRGWSPHYWKRSDALFAFISHIEDGTVVWCDVESDVEPMRAPDWLLDVFLKAGRAKSVAK